VQDEADAFVTVNSLAPILPIAAGPQGYARLVGTPHQAVFDRGLALAREGLLLKPEDMRTAFDAWLSTGQLPLDR
jgi:hypothetical protein